MLNIAALEHFRFRSGWGDGADRGALRAAKKAGFETCGFVPQGFLNPEDARAQGTHEECVEHGLVECQQPGFKCKDLNNVDATDFGIFIMRWNTAINRHQLGVGEGTQKTANYLLQGVYGVDHKSLREMCPAYGKWYSTKSTVRGAKRAMFIFVVNESVEGFARNEALQQAVANKLKKCLYRQSLVGLDRKLDVMVSGPTEGTLRGIEEGTEHFFEGVFTHLDY